MSAGRLERRPATSNSTLPSVAGQEDDEPVIPGIDLWADEPIIPGVILDEPRIAGLA